MDRFCHNTRICQSHYLDSIVLVNRQVLNYIIYPPVPHLLFLIFLLFVVFVLALVLFIIFFRMWKLFALYFLVGCHRLRFTRKCEIIVPEKAFQQVSINFWEKPYSF
jgi:hypothetical protein